MVLIILAAAISSTPTMMGMNPPIVTTVPSSTSTLTQNTNQKDNLSTKTPPNQLNHTSTLMQFNIPPPLPNLSDFSQNASNINTGNKKFDPISLDNSDQDESKISDRDNERDDRNHGRDIRNRVRDERERNVESKTEILKMIVIVEKIYLKDKTQEIVLKDQNKGKESHHDGEIKLMRTKIIRITMDVKD